MWYALLPLMMVIVTALPSAADLYIYRDAAGKRVLSNQLPPPGAEVESQRKAAPAGNTIGLPSAPATAPRPKSRVAVVRGNRTLCHFAENAYIRQSSWY